MIQTKQKVIIQSFPTLKQTIVNNCNNKIPNIKDNKKLAVIHAKGTEKEYQMGLSSSQARLLTLTSRQHSIEYAAQRLEAQKLQLANESDQVYQNYLQKLDATKVQYKVVSDDGSFRFDNATFAKLKETKKFMFKVGNEECSDWTAVKNALKSEYDIDITLGDGANSYTLLSTLISEGYVVLMEIAQDAEAGFSYDGDGIIKYTDPTTGGEKFYGKNGTGTSASSCTTAYPTDESYEMYLYKVFKDTSVSTSTSVQEVSDEIGLKKAEAEYEADMNRINAKDARYDTELAQFETERNAIKQEIDTLKTVAKENVERTFKIFS